MARDAHDLLPLKPLVFQILVALVDGDRHGWHLLRALERAGGTAVLPGQLYRQLDAMHRNGLIAEQERPSKSAAVDPESPSRKAAGGAAPRRFFRLTPFGREVLRAEAQRLEQLVRELRGKRLLSPKGTV